MEIGNLTTMLVIGFQTIFSYLNLKLLLSDKKINMFEIIILLLGAFFMVNVFLITGTYGVIVMLLFVFILGWYFIDANNLYIVGALSYVQIIMVISDHLSSMMDTYLWKTTAGTSIFSTILHMTVSIGLGFIICISIMKINPSVEKKVPFLSEFYPIISIMGVFMMLIYYSSIFLGKYLGNNVEIITLNLVFFILYFFISIVAFLMYASSTKNKYETQQKELEYLSNQRYMDVMESQFKEISKFRHDYKNILTSMENFIVERDMDGLDEYYRSMLKTSSRVIEQNNYKLEKLSNIQVRELKSILASKLITAQEKGIDVRIEVTEMIDNVNMDAVSLVRLMGIFLDNAIEELEYLGEGILSVAVYQDKQAVHLIIQNSCREDLPKLHQLKTRGFSTKGTNRGNGLSNVQEIVTEAANIRLATTIEHQLFTQKMVIEQ
ncbi:GHKL domain-containing protein [Enterococcus sp. BWB1-3]|uniref:sensor histidine kinase n=1 Tax=Enterococcus sp. BWB1-3 TaxID=2787713 RepID=UPI0019250610|nr:GHKL domain-containing protein [Enterococcus sp. BWB1-3]MBL1228351.1 GHKL domain-containing protein [Enterococcus sp. BWB1-3]